MIELRWLKIERNIPKTSSKVEKMVLQFRQKSIATNLDTGQIHVFDEWTEWEDVPIEESK